MLANFPGSFSMRQTLYQKIDAMEIKHIHESYSYDESLYRYPVNKIDRGKAKAGKP